MVNFGPEDFAAPPHEETRTGKSFGVKLMLVVLGDGRRTHRSSGHAWGNSLAWFVRIEAIVEVGTSVWRPTPMNCRPWPQAAEDFLAPYLRHMMAFFGIPDVPVLRAEGVAWDAPAIALAEADIAAAF